MAWFSDDVPREAPQRLQQAGRELACIVCKGAMFWTRTQRLESGGLLTPKPRFTDPECLLAICAACGYVHWFVQD